MTQVQCECSDTGCEAYDGHLGDEGYCQRKATGMIRRIDMDDGETTFAFCGPCADDALESGVFASEGQVRA